MSCPQTSKFKKEEAEALFINQLCITVAKFISCVIINTSLRTGEEVSKFGKQSSEMF
jgi:hypothetical protein